MNILFSGANAFFNLRFGAIAPATAAQFAEHSGPAHREQARAVGLTADAGFDSVMHEYIRENPQAVKQSLS